MKIKNPIVYVPPEFCDPNDLPVPVNKYMCKKGEVKQFYYVNKKGIVFGCTLHHTLRVMPLAITDNGYLDTQFMTVNGTTHVRVHRVVLSTFNPVPNMHELLVNHIDGNKLNNSLDNLEWCDYSRNLKHAYLTNLRHRSHDYNFYKTVIELARNKVPIREIASIVNGDPGEISDIKSGRRSYGEILKDFNLEPVPPYQVHREPLTDIEIYEIFEIIRRDYPKNVDKEIAELYNTSVWTITNLRRGKNDNYRRLQRLGLSPIKYPHF